MTKTKALMLTFKTPISGELTNKDVQMLAQYGHLAVHQNPYYATDEKDPVRRSTRMKYTATHIPTLLGVLYANNLAALKAQAKVLDELFGNEDDWASDEVRRAGSTPDLKRVVDLFRLHQPTTRDKAHEVAVKRDEGTCES